MTDAGRSWHASPAGERDSSAGALLATRPRLRVAARLSYVLVILFATLPGTEWSFDPVLIAERFRRAFYVFYGAASATDVLDGVRNVALFAGLGVVWIATTRTRYLWPPVWRATAAGALVSFLVETTQLTSGTRYASVLDLATNGFGAFAGALFTATVVRGARWELERNARRGLTTGRRHRAPLPATYLLVTLAYVGATALEAFSPPGRRDLVPGASGGAAGRFAAAVAYSARDPLAEPTALDALLYLPAGLGAVLALAASGAPPARAAWAVGLLGAGVYAWAELARGATGGDMRPLAVGAHVVAAALGAALAASAAFRRRLTTLPGRGVAWGAAALLALWYWRPFRPRPGLAAALSVDNFVPLRAVLEQFTIHTVADVGVDFLLYFSLGAWLSRRPLRRRGPFRGPAPALWAAALFETGQLWVATRYFDVTDLLVQWAGVLVAWAIVRQAALRARRVGGGTATGVRRSTDLATQDRVAGRDFR